MSSQVGARASRRLAAAVVLILVPALVLGYFGIRALAEKENGLRTTYTATTSLVRDRLAGEFAHLESQLADDVDRIALTDENPPKLRAALRSLATSRPWLATLFVLHADEGVVTADLTARGSTPRTSAIDPVVALPALAAAIREAETAEFLDDDLDRALQKYRQAQGVASSDAARGLVLMRVGRTLFKLRRFDEGITQYRAVLALPAQTVDSHGIPLAVNALLQIRDGLAALGRPADAQPYERDLLQLVADHPWDVDEGYPYFLGRALEGARTPNEELRTKAAALTERAAMIQWIQREVRPRLAPEMTTGNWTGAAAHRLAVSRDTTAVLIGYVPFPGGAGSSASAVLGYEIRPEYVGGLLLASVLKTVNLGEEMRVAVLPGRRGNDTGTSANGPAPLALAELDAVLPGWTVALFHEDGRSIDQLVRRERWIYGTLIAGMVGVLIVGVGLTIRASAREAELSRLKTEFAANVSHELKTPLALIRMFGETLESGIVTDEAKRQEFYTIIRRESDRLTHLINNVLDVARIDAGTKQYAATEGDVVAVVREAIDAYQPLFDRLGFTVENQLPPAPVFLSMDRDAIAQALINLFQNAIKYSGDVKKIAVSVVAQGDIVRVSVADRGVGIDRADVPRIFEKHYRVRAARSGAPPVSGGSGLGLSIVKHAVEAHGGRVEVETTPGQGSTFTLVLPLRDAA
jgi:signal transduction histidine kinase/tetratricopeptide (TPR) repeat protein